MQKLIISNDGYIRLSEPELFHLQFHQLCSGLNLDDNQHSDRSSKTEIRGYTEWVSHTSPSLSIGWDWILNYRGFPINTGCIYSNIMLIDSCFLDLGSEKTEQLLALFIAKLNWERKLMSHIKDKYK